MMKRILNWAYRRPEVWILASTALLTRLWTLGTPNAVVFDEIYFKGFASHYLDGQYYFDIHPPLAKLIFAGWAHLLGLSADAMANGTAVGLRILPALAGATLVVIVYAILRELHASRRLATLGASLVLLDNALLVESRFILMDSMLLATAFAAVWAWLVYRRQRILSGRSWLWLAICSTFLGLTVSIKWTGLATVGLLAVAWTFDQWRHRSSVVIPTKTGTQIEKTWPLKFLQGSLLLLIPAIIYLSVFWLHFQLLTHSGPGDAFMTPRFQATLQGNPNYSAQAQMSYWAKLIELNREMYHASATLTATHPYGSAWYSWPLELRPIYYWQGPTLANGTQGNIYLLGNPVIWWGLALTAAITLIAVNKSWAKHLRLVRYGLLVSVVGYLFNYIPFVGVHRVMFLYHYFFAFVWSIIGILLLVGGKLGWNEPSDKFNHFPSPNARYTYWAVIGLVLIGFLVFAPLSYGWPLSPNQLAWHFWLHSWR